MASLLPDRNKKTGEPNGRWRILFLDVHGRRREIRPGKMSEAAAIKWKENVELLAHYVENGQSPNVDLLKWISRLSNALADKLSAVGLIESRSAATLQAFLDDFIAGRGDTKPATRTVYGHTRRNLIAHFGPNKPLRSITPGDADKFRTYLITKARTKKEGAGDRGLDDNTVRRRCGIAKQFFRAAVRRRIIPENPFADLVGAVRGNASKFHYVTREDAQKVLDACPDNEWRLIFALSRYGGLRCPSETLLLKFDDILWDRDRIIVTSPKTEHHEGKETRIIPLFPELLPYLNKAFEEAPPGTVHVIRGYRSDAKNFRTRMRRIIDRAGLEPWPKTFQNLRSTRETELADQFPMQVVTAWMGNSQPVAAKHYLQVREEHFDQAVKGAVAPETTAQLPQQGAESGDFEGTGAANCSAIPVHAAPCTPNVGDEGLEPPTSTV